jgi:hypothetical protein
MTESKGRIFSPNSYTLQNNAGSITITRSNDDVIVTVGDDQEYTASILFPFEQVRRVIKMLEKDNSDEVMMNAEEYRRQLENG